MGGTWAVLGLQVGQVGSRVQAVPGAAHQQFLAPKAAAVLPNGLA